MTSKKRTVPIDKALELFDGPEKYNCAQAIALAYGDQFGLPEGTVQAWARCGFGKAEGGYCGAAFAVRSLLGADSPAATEFTQRFSKAAGGTKCRKVRREGKLSCEGCVETAARLLEDYL